MFMEGWSTFTNGSSLDHLGVETIDAYNGNGCCLVQDLVDDANHEKAKQPSLFYQLFKVYLKEHCSKGVVRPVPVLLGDGQLLDLYKLFSLVKERGGYATVSKKGLWGCVTKELGLNLHVLSSVKLVYDKYLNEFEGWLKKTFEDGNFRNRNLGRDVGLKSLPLELEKEFKGLFCLNQKGKDDELIQLKSNKITKFIDLVNQNSETNSLDAKNPNNTREEFQNVNGDRDKKVCNGVKVDCATSGAEITEKEVRSRKRKREALSGMLNWIRNTAKRPLDPSIQPIPDQSKWKEYKGQDFFMQTLRAREVLLQRQCEPNRESSSSQKLKMHPAMYEDRVALGHNSPGKLRCSERRASLKSRKPYYATGSGSKDSVMAEKSSPTTTVDLTADLFEDDYLEKQVSVGPHFQAEVPQWPGGSSESDSKWLGTQVWPALTHDSKPAWETDLIGRGRQEKCHCKFKGSVECIRFHIAESRMKLKLELGSTFYCWGFDRMGEEVSLRWTVEEEKKFKDIMRLSIPYEDRSFWNNPSKYFPKKTRKSLVNYYFNVYLIGLRSYQNRVTPKSVDSDDDETEFGSFGDGFGMEAIKGPGNNFMECVVNKQCTDFWS